MPTRLFANSDEIKDLSEDLSIVNINKGDVAKFTGALLPYNTFRRYEEFRMNYELLRYQYELNGDKDMGLIGGIKKDVALVVMFISAGILTGAVVSTSDRSVSNTIYIMAGGALVGSVLVLSF